MELYVVMRFLCDFAFYFSTIGYLASYFGSGQPMIVPLLLLLLVGSLSYPLRKKGALRYLPLVLLLGCLPYAATPADWAVLGAAALYLVLAVAKGHYLPRYEDYHDFLSKGRWCLLAVYGGSLLFHYLRGAQVGILPRLEEYGLPFLVMYLPCAILLLRLLRHEDAVLTQRRFQIQNLLTVLISLALGFAASSQTVLDGVAAALKAFYHWVIMPPLLLLAQVMGSIITFLFYDLLVWIFSEDRSPGQTAPVQEFSLADLMTEEEMQAAYKGVDVGTILLIGLAILCLIAAAVFLIRRMLKMRAREEEPYQGTTETREQLKDGRRRTKRPSYGHSPKGQVRYCFYKLMQRLQKDGETLSPSETSRQIAGRASRLYGGEAEELREIYAKVRYSDDPVDREAARRAKEIYAKLIKGKR